MRIKTEKKIRLKKGIHAAVVTSTRPGYGGSLLACETYMACKLSGIPAILGTYEMTKIYPQIGSDLRRLAKSGNQNDGGLPLQATDSMVSLIAEAREKNAMLIIDVKSGQEGETALKDVAESLSLAEADTIIALLPALHGMETDFRKLAMLDIRFTSIMIRYWGFRSPNIEVDKSKDQRHHHWRPGFLTKEMVDVIFNGSLPSLLNASDHESHDSEPKTPLENVGRYLERARLMFFEAILGDLVDKFEVMENS